SRVWDGSWFAAIAEDGYPAELPLRPNGDIAYSPWPFFPLYPMLARAIMRVTGLPWEFVGPTLSLALGAAAMVLLFHLLRVAAPDLVAERPALPYSAVAVMCFFPAAGAFSMSYSDSLALALVLCTLLAIVRRRYAMAIAPLL